MTRAKFERFTCDRCGDHQDIGIVVQTEPWHEIAFFQPTTKVRVTHDICDGCIGDFAIWLSEPKVEKKG